MEGDTPARETLERAREDAREGRSPSTQAGEFVREEIHHVREGKHGARSPEQAIAIGLSKARRAGVKVPAKKGGSTRSKSRTAKKRSKPSPPCGIRLKGVGVSVCRGPRVTDKVLRHMWRGRSKNRSWWSRSNIRRPLKIYLKFSRFPAWTRS